MERYDDLAVLLKSNSQGTLSTISSEIFGFPFGSLIVYAMLPIAGRLAPCFVMSDLAEHAKNIKEDNRASLLVSKPGSSIFSPIRATWCGRAARNDDLKEAFIQAVPESEMILGMKDFAVYSMSSGDKVRYIGGFGKIYWVDPVDIIGLAV